MNFIQIIVDVRDSASTSTHAQKASEDSRS